MTLPRIPSALPRPYRVKPCPRTQPFWDALADGKLLVAKCQDCGKTDFPPRNVCSGCLGSALAWQQVSGNGRLYAATRVHAAGAGFACRTPYSVGLIDLEEGIRVLTRLLPSASSLLPDSDICLAIIDHTDGPLFAAIAPEKSNDP